MRTHTADRSWPGYCLYRRLGQFCAQVAEGFGLGTGFGIERIWVVANCGVVLPGTVEAQLQGAVADVLGVVLGGGVTFDHDVPPFKAAFTTYPMLRCHRMPKSQSP